MTFYSVKAVRAPLHSEQSPGNPNSTPGKPITSEPDFPPPEEKRWKMHYSCAISLIDSLFGMGGYWVSNPIPHPSSAWGAPKGQNRAKNRGMSVCTPDTPLLSGEWLALPYLGRGHPQRGVLWKQQRLHSVPPSSWPLKLTPSWTFQKVARVGTWATPLGEGSRWARNLPSCRQQRGVSPPMGCNSKLFLSA